MIYFVINKIKNKKWLSICLLVGITLLIAIFSCHPMLEKGAADNLLQESFAKSVKEKNEHSFIISDKFIGADSGGKTIDELLSSMNDKEAYWQSYVKLDKIDSQHYIRLSLGNAQSNRKNNTATIGAGLIDNMEAHTEIVHGSGLEGAAIEKDKDGNNVYSGLVSEQVMDEEDLLVGDILTYTYSSKDGGDIQFSIKITGVFKKTDASDIFWHVDLPQMAKTVFVDKASLESINELATTSGFERYDSLMLDYAGLNRENALDYLGYLEQIKDYDSTVEINAISLLKKYRTDFFTVRTVLYVLELPCVVLILLFIFMVSTQVFNLEASEMAVLRSRGVKKGQVVKIYFIQSSIMAFAGMILGILLGMLICKIAVSTDGFLSFRLKSTPEYGFTPMCFAYSAIAAFAAIVFMTIPVFRRSKNTIVAQKSTKKYSESKAFFERFFLDFALIAVSVYFLFTYRRQLDILAKNVIEGKRLDPIMFLDSSIFIFACGLLVIRLIRYLIILIDKLGKKRWKPDTYASFLQIRRTYAKQSFIALFLIMTMANGIFNSNMARTINENTNARLTYDIGCEAVATGTWEKSFVSVDKTSKVRYKEPDFNVYSEIINNGMCDSVTRVIKSFNGKMSGGGNTLYECEIMGVNTREFGLTSSFEDKVNEEHWYNALNKLAENPNGVIISKNVAEKLSLAEGDTMSLAYMDMNSSGQDEIPASTYVVVAVVDAFPGYNQYYYVDNEEGIPEEREQHLAVTNYASFLNSFGMVPYEVWMNLSDGTNPEEVKDFLIEKGASIESFESLENTLKKNNESALIQITNGMFTLSFIIPLITASLGFLLYWIMSIRNRELLFGIYRAMGMPMKSINKMLILEQLTSSVLPLVGGTAIGSVCTYIFVRFVSVAYLPKKHVIPIDVCFYPGDLFKLAGILLAVFVICVLIIRRLLKNMKITQALKLGED